MPASPSHVPKASPGLTAAQAGLDRDANPAAPAAKVAPPLPVTPEEAAQRVYGVIDMLRPNRIAGWAVDRANSSAAVQIDIRREGRLIKSIRADRHRPDLEKGGIGTGHYGFAADLSPPVEPGFEFTVTAVARAADGSQALLRPVGLAESHPSVEERLLQEIYLCAQMLVQKPAQTAKAASDPAVARLEEMVNRLEVMQARIEAAMQALDQPAPPARDRGVKLILWSTCLVALTSLGIGIASLWGG